MSQQTTPARRIVLARRPQGAPVPDDFRLERVDLPAPGAGQVLLQTLYLSLDPYMRGRMSEGPSYAPALDLGETMPGTAVARVLASNADGYAQGDLVLAAPGWQDHALADAAELTALGALAKPSLALSVLGMPGFTAWHGLLKIGAPKAGETVVVAAASGAVGSVVGQLARLHGARVVGVAGGADKCRHVVEELGFDACIDRNGEDFAERLAAACPDGIDVYFENVGGAVLDAVVPLLNDHARVPVCGTIAHYNGDTGDGGAERLVRLMSTILARRVRVQGFIILDHYGEEFAEFSRQMGKWVAEGAIKVREDVVDGFEQAPAALIGLLKGSNFGKLLVRVAE